MSSLLIKIIICLFVVCGILFSIEIGKYVKKELHYWEDEE